MLAGDGTDCRTVPSLPREIGMGMTSRREFCLEQCAAVESDAYAECTQIASQLYGGRGAPSYLI